MFRQLFDAMLVGQEGLTACFLGWFCQKRKERSAMHLDTQNYWVYVVILCGICITGGLGQLAVLTSRNRKRNIRRSLQDLQKHLELVSLQNRLHQMWNAKVSVERQLSQEKSSNESLIDLLQIEKSDKTALQTQIHQEQQEKVALQTQIHQEQQQKATLQAQVAHLRQNRHRTIHCLICRSDLDELSVTGVNLQIARCGHMACETCLNRLFGDATHADCVSCRRRMARRNLRTVFT